MGLDEVQLTGFNAIEVKNVEQGKTVCMCRLICSTLFQKYILRFTKGF